MNLPDLRLLIVSSSILFLVFAEQLTAQDQQPITSIAIHSPQWDGFTNEDLSGLYTETFKSIFEPEGVTAPQHKD